MASNPQFWSDGFGGAANSTAPIAGADDIYVYGDLSTRVYFVSSVTGSNSNDGTRDDPYATFAYAVTQAGYGDVIVILSGHTESITADISISVRLIVIGEGVGNSRPSFTPATAGAEITITDACHFHGLRFLAATATYTTAQIIATAAGAIGCRFAYCEFISGDKEASVAKLTMNNAAGFLDNCTFTSSGTTYDLRPYGAFTGARLVRNCTINGGTYGWQTTATMLFGWGNTASGPVGLGGTSSISVIQCELTNDAYFDVTSTPDYHIYPEGLGLTGHPLLSGKGLFVSGDLANVQYVNSVTGTDAANYGGSYKRPVATLKYAVNTNNSVGLIVVAAGHAETVITASILADAGGLIIVGEGSGDTRPAITRNWNGILIDMDSAACTGICNLRFPISGTSSAAVRVSAQEAGSFIHQCEFKCGANDVGPSISATAPLTSADDLLIDSCVFISAVTAITTMPTLTVDANDNDNLIMINCTFDGGAYGWLNGEAAAPSAQSLYIDNLTLIRDSILVVEPQSYAVAIDAFIQVQQATGQSGILSRPVN